MEYYAKTLCVKISSIIIKKFPQIMTVYNTPESLVGHNYEELSKRMESFKFLGYT